MSDRIDPNSFDETNGEVQGLEGESNGTAAGDLESTAEQDHEIEPRPVGAQDTFESDWYGESDGKDPNP